MTKIKDIIQYLENIAPLNYQEHYDNSGLLTGDSNDNVTGIMICLDSTEDVVSEAIDKKCNLIVAHHPIIFSGLKKITGSNYVERTIIKAIKNNIAIYAIHTNLDNVSNGVNRKIAEKIGLNDLKILSPKDQLLSKLVSFVPKKDTANVLRALGEAGAGNIGNYKNCSFKTEGTGTFEPNELASPYIGEANVREEVIEDRIELIFPSYMKNKIVATLKKEHPYEEVAFYIQKLENSNYEVGSGMIGVLSEEISEEEFMASLKKKMQLSGIRHTPVLGKNIRKIAVCGGSGSFLLKDAISQSADVFITSDFKYHEFFDAENRIVIMDIGHYESEVFTKELIYELINKNFTNIALYLTEQVTNPIRYF